MRGLWRGQVRWKSVGWLVVEADEECKVNFVVERDGDEGLIIGLVWY